MKGELSSVVRQGDAKLTKAISDKLDSLESSLTQQNDQILSAISTVSQRLSNIEQGKQELTAIARPDSKPEKEKAAS
jgi:hypothetical protein